MCDCRENLIKNYDFTESYNPSDFNIVIGNDGVVTQDEKGLNVTSNPFDIFTGKPVGTNNVHWLRYSTDRLAIDENKIEELCVETIMSSESYLDNLNQWVDENPKLRDRFGDLCSDFRIAHSSFSVFDINFLMDYSFIITNDTLFVQYGRLPDQKNNYYLCDGEGSPFKVENSPLGEYAAFSYAVPVFKICDCKLLKLKIGFNAKVNTINWYVNDEKVFSWDKPGYRFPDNRYLVMDYGGNDTLLKLGVNSDLHYGFGTFKALDYFRPPSEFMVDGCGYILNIKKDLNRFNSGLVQVNYNENYKNLSYVCDNSNSIHLHNCSYFGIIGSCQCNVSNPSVDKDPNSFVPFEKRYLPIKAQGSSFTVEELSIISYPSEGGKSIKYPFEIKHKCCF